MTGKEGANVGFWTPVISRLKVAARRSRLFWSQCSLVVAVSIL